MKRNVEAAGRNISLARGPAFAQKLPRLNMTPRNFFRRTQALWTTMLLGTLTACTNIKNDSARKPTGGAPAADTTAGKKEGASGLDGELAGLHHQIAVRREYNEALHVLVADKEKELAAVLALDRSAGPTAREFDLRTSVNSKLSEVDREAKSWQETIDAHRAVLNKSANDPHHADLQSGIDLLSEERATLLRDRVSLFTISDKLKR